MMFYSIIMITGTVLRAGARCYRHPWLKTIEEHVPSDSPSKNTINARFFKDVKLAKCLVVSFHVPTLKTRSKRRICKMKTFLCSLKQLKETLFWYISVFSFEFFYASKHLASFVSLLYFLTDCPSAHAPLLLFF